MNISISEKEYDAINNAIAGIEGQLESCESENDIKWFKEQLVQLYKVTEKYKKALLKVQEFKAVRAVIAKDKALVKRIRPKDIDAMTRKTIKNYHQKNIHQ